MKLIILIYVVLVSLIPYNQTFASTNFAKITSNYCYLYKTASSEINNNVICYLEETYFVEITLDYSTDFYKVNYNGTSGFVLKNNVTKIIGTPKNPYPKTNLISIDNKCYLRSTPNVTDTNIVTVVPSNCTDLVYIGKIYGEEAIDYQGNLWYLVTYYGVTGYIYSKYIKSIEPILINTEVIEITQNNLNKNPTPLNNLECGIIILVLSIPIIFIVIVMYKQPKSFNQAKVNKTKKLPKVTKIDYDDLL